MIFSYRYYKTNKTKKNWSKSMKKGDSNRDFFSIDLFYLNSPGSKKLIYRKLP